MWLKWRNLSSLGKKTLWEKEENAGHLHFLLFSQCFENASILRLCGEGLTLSASKVNTGTFADGIDQDQTAQNVQSDL